MLRIVLFATLFVWGCDFSIGGPCLFNDASNSYFPPTELTPVTVALGDSAVVYAPTQWRAPKGECDKGENDVAWVEASGGSVQVRTVGNYIVITPRSGARLGDRSMIRVAARGLGFMPGSDPDFVYDPVSLDVTIGRETSTASVQLPHTSHRPVRVRVNSAQADTLTLAIKWEPSSPRESRWFAFDSDVRFADPDGCKNYYSESEIGCVSDDSIRVVVPDSVHTVKGFVSNGRFGGSEASGSSVGLAFEVTRD